jgi:gamma-glutamyltranspeptidase/glutathione hydrolase
MKLFLRLQTIILLIFFMACQPIPQQNIHTKKVFGTIAKNGMIASAHPLASAVGVEILKKGGNAADAAVAVFFALAVVYPRAGNIGGGGFAVCRWNIDGKISEKTTLDFRETAPKAATKDMYLDKEGNAQIQLSLAGHLAAGVPSSVDGMVELHKKYGKLTWKELLQPSIDLAEKGFAITENDAEYLDKYQADFIAQNPINLPKQFIKTKWKQGDMLYQTDLAKTLKRIQIDGRKGFYEGETAYLLLQEIQKGKGIICYEDLQNYHSIWRKPVLGNYKNYQIITMAPPSSGGIALLQLLRASEKYPLRKWGHNTAKTIHVMTEMERRVYADRATHLGDPDFYKVPQEMLLDKNYIAKRMSDISLTQKTSSQTIKQGNVTRMDSYETTHLSVVDADRNAISITTTLNGNYGCKVMVAGAGFFLNNEMDDFSIKPGVANQFGLIGGEANAIAANKRMLSSMTPTIIEQNGKLFMVLGTPGGSTIITSVYQTILNVLEHGMTMQEAVDAKKFHHQWLPDEIMLEEKAFPERLQNELIKLGHTLRYVSSLGRMDCVLVLPDGSLEGGSDNTRADNTSLGY